MAEALQACCQRAQEAYVKHLANAIVSYPVIKTIPCPTCRRVISIRLYEAPRETGKTA